jgi:hypothetical protein
LALAKVAHATEWAYRFTSGIWPSHKGFRRQAAPAIVQDAVEGIAQACVPDPDGMLHALLVETIDVCAAWVDRDPNHGYGGRSQLVGEHASAHRESVPARLATGLDR